MQQEIKFNKGILTIVKLCTAVNYFGLTVLLFFWFLDMSKDFPVIGILFLGGVAIAGTVFISYLQTKYSSINNGMEGT